MTPTNVSIPVHDLWLVAQTPQSDPNKFSGILVSKDRMKDKEIKVASVALVKVKNSSGSYACGQGEIKTFGWDSQKAKIKLASDTIIDSLNNFLKLTSPPADSSITEDCLNSLNAFGELKNKDDDVRSHPNALLPSAPPRYVEVSNFVFLPYAKRQ